MIAEKLRAEVCELDNCTVAPVWMRRTLIFAAVYNLAWGAFAIFSPLSIFRWTGFEPLPIYPELWQCVGMIVGVYGIGYWIAAFNPYRHWPIVLVGLLGKIFGPIGFASSVLSGRLPAALGFTIITNDLIWWVPFSVILWKAAQANQSEHQKLTVAPAVRAIDPMGRIMSQLGGTISELSRRKPLLVVFLRHSGCTFCREALADLAEQRQQIESRAVSIALVHMGHEEPTELLTKHKLTDLHCFRDPVCALYDAFGLKMGGFSQLFGMKVWWRGLKAWGAGHGIGPLNGNGFRMPGVFLIKGGVVLRSYRHRSAADRPNYADISVLPDSNDASAQADSASQDLAEV